MSDDETRHAYDTVAVDYAARVGDEIDRRPLDRALLAVVGEMSTGPIADLGCGPGGATAHLAALGHDAFGVDLSPAMVEVARARHPGIRFEVGSMDGLDADAASLGGIVAFYSIIHTPPAGLPAVFAEFARVLRPGAPVLLVFQVGDEHLHIEHGFGHDVSLDTWRWRPDLVTRMLAEAGIRTLSTTVREPVDETERGQRAYVLAVRGDA